MAEFEIDFVRHGAVAPEKLSPDEVWIDVGGRLDSQVIDHHSGEKTASALVAMDMVFERNWHPPKSQKLKVVTHIHPDLDAVVATWILLRGSETLWRQRQADVQTLVEATCRHDQGIEEFAPIDRSWPIIMSFALNSALGQSSDDEAMALGLTLLDKSLNGMPRGGSAQDAAVAISDDRITKYLSQQKDAYERDCTRAQFKQFTVPQDEEGGSSTLDAFIIRNPECSMLKHFARRSDLASLGRGFSMLVISTTVPVGDLPAWRHVISLDARYPGSLYGLGARLEEAEQVKEGSLSVPLRKGRERTAPGQGRFGSNVVSPWYDGRGHDYTIVDSPAVEYASGPTIASLLSPDEIINILEAMYCPFKAEV